MSRHQIQGKSCLASHVAKDSGICTKNRITDEQSPYKFCHVQADTKLTAHTHAGGKKGKAHHDHKHWQKTFSRAVRYCLQLVILLFLICLVIFHNTLLLFFSLLFFLAKKVPEYLTQKYSGTFAALKYSMSVTLCQENINLPYILFSNTIY